jgi:hypothetical protein
MISSFGIVPCNTRLKPIRTQGKYGAVKEIRPMKLSLVSGFLRDQMYTSVEESGWPRKGMETSGDIAIKQVIE